MKQEKFIYITTVALSMLLFARCTKEQGSDDSEKHHGVHRSETTESSIVHLDNHKVFHAGIRTARVESKSVAVPVMLTGKVVFNERRVAEIAARVSGRIEKVSAFANDHTVSGASLIHLYSQEFLLMQNEFILASDRWKRMQQSVAEEQSTAKSIYESARRKLALVGVTDQEITELETTRTPRMLYVVRSPFGGTILTSYVRQGAVVESGTKMFELADLSTLWVIADIYEKDLPHVHAGMRAQVVVAAYPDSFSGTISTVYSVMDEKTRTVKARVEVSNRAGLLKPEMFCNVLISTRFGKETIKIPASALLGETEKHFVFVAVNDTTFEKRDIRTGAETRDFAEVLDGLLIGEKLVVKGGFFLKSELAKETFGEEH